MISLKIKDGLPFADVTFINNDMEIEIRDALIDTGSVSTIITTDIAYKIGLQYNPDDVINTIFGIGGSEFVYQKIVDSICLGKKKINELKIQVSAMNYGYDVDAIIGMDFLTKANAVINLKKSTVTFEY